MANKFLDSIGVNHLWEKMKTWVTAQGYKTTDTNTWRPVVNNLTSTATDSSLSAAQGKALNDKIAAIIDGSQYVQNAIDADSALYASEAGSVAWANVTGKTNATTSTAGLMSATDKTNLDTIVNSFNSDDADTTIETIKEVLKVFESYPAGTSLANALAGKLDKSGGSLNNSATLKFTMYGTRTVTISGNSIDADMSADTGTWAGNFATVKHSKGTTTMLGWYGSKTDGLYSIFMGGSYSDPAMKMDVNGNFTFKNTITGTITNATQLGGIAASNYATTSALSNYLPLSGGTLSSTLTMTPNKPQIQFRGGHTSYDCVISYGTDGNEAMVFSTKNAITSFMFVNGEDIVTNISGGRWQSLTPGLQIKNNCVSIGKLIANGVTPTYKLDVNGSLNATTIYESGTALSSKYLGISAKATSATTADNATNADSAVYATEAGVAYDSNKLGGVVASSYVTLTGSQALTNKTYNGYTLAAACAKGVTDSTSASALSTGTNLVTERDVYYGLASINGARQTSSVSIYAPTSIGSNGYLLKATGTGAPTWVDPKTVIVGTAEYAEKADKDGLGNYITSTYLPKTTYEYNKEIAFGSTGKLYIGAFPMYDSNITVEISATTSTTYNATLVIATQNINTTGGGSLTATVYGDATNTIAPNIYIGYASGSNQIHVYFSPQAWSKNLIHIQAVALAGAPSNVCTSVDSIPSTANRQPTNALTANFQAKGDYLTKTTADATYQAKGTYIAPTTGSEYYPKYIQTRTQNKTSWYEAQYPIYAWWETNTICKWVVDNYETKVDRAVKDADGNTITSYYQAKLTSGTNIKTINGTSILGSGNITISGGSGSCVKLFSGSVLLSDIGSYISSSYNTYLMTLSSAYCYDNDDAGPGFIIVNKVYSGYYSMQGVMRYGLSLGDTILINAEYTPSGSIVSDTYDPDAVTVSEIYAFS